MAKCKKIKMNKERDIYSRIHGLRERQACITYIVCHNASIPMWQTTWGDPERPHKGRDIWAEIFIWISPHRPYSVTLSHQLWAGVDRKIDQLMWVKPQSFPLTFQWQSGPLEGAIWLWERSKAPFSMCMVSSPITEHFRFNDSCPQISNHCVYIVSVLTNLTLSFQVTFTWWKWNLSWLTIPSVNK